MSNIEFNNKILCREVSLLASEALWFRGHSKASYKNIPSIYRETSWENGEYNFHYDFESFKQFKHQCKIPKDSDYEYLHLMQHFGLPTKLLDWTASSLIALFFALCSKRDCENPIVWIIEPSRFNAHIHQDENIFYFFGKKTHPMLPAYLVPKSESENESSDISFKHLPLSPAAVMPSHIDDRVIAQQSRFIIFGQEKTPIEELEFRDRFFLSKIMIDQDSIDDIFIDLIMSGINYSTIYPDMEGLTKEIKRKWRMK